MNRAVVRVFFPNGLYKTASIDETVSCEELCRMIAHKLEIERKQEVSVSDCTLFECCDDSEVPWKGSQFGTSYRIIGTTETLFSLVREWVAQGTTAKQRFVFMYKSDKDPSNSPLPKGISEAPKKEKQSEPKKPHPAPAKEASTTTPKKPAEKSRSPSPNTPDLSSSGSASEAGSRKTKFRPSVNIRGQEESDTVLLRSCLSFANRYLSKRGISVSGIEDFRDGHYMVELCEELTGVQILPHNRKPEEKEQKIANWASALRIMKTFGCNFQNCIAEDCYYGTQDTIVMVLTAMNKHFSNMPAFSSALRRSILISESKKDDARKSIDVKREKLAQDEISMRQKELFLREWERELHKREADINRRQVELERREMCLEEKKKEKAASESSQISLIGGFPGEAHFVVLSSDSKRCGGKDESKVIMEIDADLQMTVGDVLRKICARDKLVYEDWELRFLTMDLSCDESLKLADVGVFAMRLCRSVKDESSSSSKTPSLDGPVIDTSELPETDHLLNQVGLASSSFDMGFVQEQQL